MTAYDAAYVALAETLLAPLLTLDAHLASAPVHEAGVSLDGFGSNPEPAVVPVA